MTIKVKPRPTRLLRVGAKLTRKETVVREMDAVAERHIMSHPQYEMILASLREGISVAEIARYFAEEQWVTVSEKTFAEYLYVFRRRRISLINQTQADGEKIDLNRKVSGRNPDLDLDQEMDRAIRFQKVRVGLGHTNEVNLGLPLEQVGRDVVTLGKLLELKLKRQGLRALAKGLQTQGPLAAPAQVRDELNQVVRSQGDTDKLHTLTAQLMERVRDN
jgi:hypothetical protein